MQAIGDLFQKFSPELPKAVTLMAEGVGEKRDTVYRWLRAGRIPESSWSSVIDAAAARGIEVDTDTLLRLNRPAKRRGRKPAGCNGRSGSRPRAKRALVVPIGRGGRRR